MSGEKVPIFSLDGGVQGEFPLPPVFETPYRPDLIRRAVISLQSHGFQKQGRNPMAGKRTTAESFGVGRGLSRVPRVRGERHRHSGQAAFAPGTVGGRLAHPPRTDKRIAKKVNRKERLLALKSAIAATARKEIVQERGHRIPDVKNLPLVVVGEVESVSKASDARRVLAVLGLQEDLERADRGTRERAGIGKSRGRRLRRKIGPLVVVSDDSMARRGFGNLPGVQVVRVKDLNVELLAPGTFPGRLTIWSENALKTLESLK